MAKFECVEIINANKNWKSFVKQRARIVKIYNETHPFYDEKVIVEKSDYKDAQCCMVVRCKGVNGGVYIERLLNNESCAVICFAGIDKPSRGSDLCRLLIKYAYYYLRSINVNLIGVQLNDFDEIGYWEHIGFKEKTRMQNGCRMLLISEPELLLKS